MIPGITAVPVAAGGAAKEPFSLTFITSAVNPANQTTYNFELSVGDDVSGENTRYTVVVVSKDESVSSVTILGQAASLVSDGTTSASANDSGDGVDHWIADTTGLGTSGTTTVVYSTGGGRCGIAGLYRLINPSGAQADDVTTNTSGTNPKTLSLDILAGGAAVAGVFQGSAGGTSTWTGLTENNDESVESNWFQTSASGGAAGTPHAVTVETSASPARFVGVSSSWSPAA